MYERTGIVHADQMTKLRDALWAGLATFSKLKNDGAETIGANMDVVMDMISAISMIFNYYKSALTLAVNSAILFWGDGDSCKTPTSSSLSTPLSIQLQDLVNPAGYTNELGQQDPASVLTGHATLCSYLNYELVASGLKTFVFDTRFYMGEMPPGCANNCADAAEAIAGELNVCGPVADHQGKYLCSTGMPAPNTDECRFIDKTSDEVQEFRAKISQGLMHVNLHENIRLYAGLNIKATLDKINDFASNSYEQGFPLCSSHIKMNGTFLHEVSATTEAAAGADPRKFCVSHDESSVSGWCQTTSSKHIALLFEGPKTIQILQEH